MNTASIGIRIRAASVHLAISGLVACIAVALIFGIWYPGALSEAQGVDRLILILIGVDVVLGPLMTLILFIPRKKGLWLDLVCIAIMQTSAFLYGITTIFGGRPAYVVFNVDRFDVVPAQDVDRASLEKAMARGEPGISWFGPRWTAASVPTDPKEANELLFSAVAGGADLPQLPHLFVPLETGRAQMLSRIRPLRELKSVNELDETQWQALLAELGKAEDEMGYVPLKANARDGAVILDRESADVLGIRLLQPKWGGAPERSKAPEPPSKGVPLSSPRPERG